MCFLCKQDIVIPGRWSSLDSGNFPSCLGFSESTLQVVLWHIEWRVIISLNFCWGKDKANLREWLQKVMMLILLEFSNSQFFKSLNHIFVYQFTRKRQCSPQSLTIIVIKSSKLLQSGVVTKWCTQLDLLHFPSQKLL